MATFPGAIPSYTGFTPGHTLLIDVHASQHNLEQADIAAIATKIGTSASTPTSGLVLRGTGAGTSSWGQTVLTTDVTGILPVANGGTGIASLGAGVATFLGTPNSANLAAALTDETGSGALVFGTSPTIVTPTIASFVNANHDHTNAAGGGTLGTTALVANAVGVSRLASVETTDLFSGTTLTSATWTDLKGNQNFTVDNANSVILVWLAIGMSAGNSGTPAVAGRIVIDSAGANTPYLLGSGKVQTAASFVNPFGGAGPVIITGLSAGIHTIKSQVYSDSANTQIFLRASSVPNIEFLTTNVLELKR